MGAPGRHALRRVAAGRPHRARRGPAAGHDAHHPADRGQGGPAGRGGGLCRHLAGHGRQQDRHRRHGLWRRLPAPRRLRHAGAGRRQARRARRPGLDGHAGDRPRPAIPRPRSATPVTLWGEGLPVETVAAHAGTIAYELLCGLTGRVHVELRDDPRRASRLSGVPERRSAGCPRLSRVRRWGRVD